MSPAGPPPIMAMFIIHSFREASFVKLDRLSPKADVFGIPTFSLVFKPF
jgi:hypothetical protein